MNSALIKYNEDNYAVSISISLIIHTLIILAAIFIFDITVNSTHKPSSYVQVYTSEFENIKNTNSSIEKRHADKPFPIKKALKKEDELNKIIGKKENQSNENAVTFLNFSEINSDTTNLDKYTENQL